MSQADSVMTSSLSCSGCGADMKYSPTDSCVKCPYCAMENEIPVSDNYEAKETDYKSVLASLEVDCEHENIESMVCESCGAEVYMAGHLAASACQYCGSSIISEKHVLRQIKPTSLLPFAIESDKANANFKEWLQKRWFLPNDAKKLNKHSSLKGVYVPYWTYDMNTKSLYTGSRGDYYYETKHYTETDSQGCKVNKTRRVRKTRWTSTSGIVNNCFDDILVVGSNKLNNIHTQKLEPWDLENLVEFDHSYLSGFMSETYSVSLESGFENAKDLAMPQIKYSIKRDIGGDEQRISGMNINYEDIKFKHILLPVWLSSFKYKNKVYNFLVNARTGEVQGERPWSVIKIIATIILVFFLLIVFFSMFK